MLKEDFKQKFFSKLLIILLIGVAFCLCMDVLNDLQFLWRSDKGSITVYYYLFNSYSFGGQYLPYFALALTTMIGTVDYCKEANSGVDWYIIQRLGSVKKYALSKLWFSIVTSGFIYVAGIALFAFIAGMFQPFYSQSFNPETEGLPYYEFLWRGEGFRYLAVILYLAFLTAIFYNMIALLLSAYIKNVYIVMATPILAAYVLRRLLLIFRVKWEYRLDLWLSARATLGTNRQTLISCTIVVFIICLLCGIGFVRKVKRDEERK